MRLGWSRFVAAACVGVVVSFAAFQSSASPSEITVAQAGPGGPKGPRGPGGPGGGPRGPGGGGPGDVQPSEVPWTDVQIHLRAGAARNFDAVIGLALKQTARLNRKMLVLVPQPFPYEGSNANAHDYDVFLDSVKRNPDKLAFLGGSKLNAILQATDPKKVTDAVKRQFLDQANKTLDDGARGFGELAVLHFSEFQGHPYERVQPDHPLLLALADLTAQRNALMAIHIEAVEHGMPLPKGLKSPPNPSYVEEDIAAFERLLSHNPNARIVWLHNGWDNTGQRTPELVQKLMAAHPNLSIALKFHRSRFTENAVVTGSGLNGGWVKVMRAFPDRVVIGSDTFFAGAASQAGEKFEPQPMMVLLSRLTPPLREKVAFENAERIYNLNGR